MQKVLFTGVEQFLLANQRNLVLDSTNSENEENSENFDAGDLEYDTLTIENQIRESVYYKQLLTGAIDKQKD